MFVAMLTHERLVNTDNWKAEAFMGICLLLL